VRTVSADHAHIDYFQSVSSAQGYLSNRFGIRVRPGFCSAVVRNAEGQVNCIGQEFQTPLHLGVLPVHLRMIVGNHVLKFPASDLIDVLTGKKSFREALDSAARIDCKPAAHSNGDGRSDLFAGAHYTFQQTPAGFLSIELAACSRSANLAIELYKSGDTVSAEWTTAVAEECHSEAVRFLSDPKDSSDLTVNDLQEFTAAAKALRKTLNALRRSQTKSKKPSTETRSMKQGV
jgi:hypothetical protein